MRWSLSRSKGEDKEVSEDKECEMFLEHGP